MTHLTPEQVAKLRLPEGYEIVDDPVDDYNPYSLEYEDCQYPSTESSIANCAIAVANGHLPPEALDDVWRRVDGKPSREAELLRAVTETHTAAIKASAAARAARCDDMEWAQRDADEQEAADAFRTAMSAARKWIEEQTT